MQDERSAQGDEFRFCMAPGTATSLNRPSIEAGLHRAVTRS